jgi:hypothetical protein
MNFRFFIIFCSYSTISFYYLQDNKGKTAIDIAREQKKQEIVAFLEHALKL